jgi:hypothetical protein
MTFSIALPAPVDVYASLYDMKYLASLVTYVVLRVENSQLVSRNTRTDHYSPIMGGSTSVDACVQATIQGGVPRNQIVLSSPAYSIRFKLEVAGGFSSGFGDSTTGEIWNRLSYKAVKQDIIINVLSLKS